MGQVPKIQKNYLIIGGGRLATHLSIYFNKISLPYYHWTRKSDNSTLSSYLKLSKKVLLAVADDAIDELSINFKSKMIIHFSGAISTAFAESAHPLFTFGFDEYDKNTYESIPFITEKGRKSFKELFPELINPTFQIDKKDKILYHAWSSMAGNFSSILIMEYTKKLIEIGLPPNLAKPYLTQMLHNSINNQRALTGPIDRGDKKTIKKHLAAIDKEFKEIYNSFVTLKTNQTS